MKTLLIVGGVLFLLLAIALMIAALVAFLMGRKRQSSAQAAGTAPAGAPPPVNPSQGVPAAPVTYTPPVQAHPPSPPPPPLPPAVPPPDPDLDRTVLTDPRAGELWGSLDAIAGPLAGRVFTIDANGFYIGRDRTLADVVIDIPSISKRHVWVGVRDGAVLAIDQGSTNGTHLNDPASARITEVRLSPGDTLILGGDVARFLYRA